MAITFQNLGASVNPDIDNGSGASSYSNSSWTPPTSGLILLSVHSRASPSPNTPTVSGNGITWVHIATVTIDTVQGLWLFGANASGSSAGATTISFGGQSQLWCNASFFHADGVDLSGGVAAAFVQSPTNTGVNVNNLSITLNAAGNADNRPIACFFHNSTEVTTPRANWTEADDMGTAGSHETQWRSDAFETTASASWASFVSAIGIAAELKAEVAGGDISGSAAGAATVGASLKGTAGLSGTATALATLAAVLIATGALTGAIAAAATTSGALAATGELAGSAAGIATSGAAMVADGDLAGSSAGSVTISGMLVADGELVGLSAGAATVSGTLLAGGIVLTVVQAGANIHLSWVEA